MGRAAQAGHDVVLVRPARVDDGVGLSHLLDVLGYPCPAEEAAQRVLDVHDDPNQTALVAEHEGQLAGLLCIDLSYYLPLGAFTCRITALSVAGNAQRRGIGRRLLKEAESLARSAGAVRIELTSAAHREEAHAFYRACGYGEGAVRFVKRLGDA